MIDRTKHDYRFIELDGDLLKLPFKVQTNWHVITGSVSSGKSTLIDQLAGMGLQTVPESARQYFENEIAKGRTIEEIRSDIPVYTRCVLDLMREAELSLNADECLFLDRAFPDVLAFCRTNGLNPNDYLADCFRHRYASVFLLERFSVEEDGIRTEDEATADLIDEWHERDYRALGYNIVKVPVMSREERLAFVLETLVEKGLVSDGYLSGRGN